MVVAGISDELVGFGEESAEGFIGVDDSEFRRLPAQLASLDMQVPEGLGDKEVVILDFTIKVLRGNVEDGLSSVEVEVHSVCFGNIGLP